MKTTQELVDEIITGVLIHKTMGDKEIKALLKDWADSIVDECAEKADTKYSKVYCIEIKYEHTIDRDSILDVKNQIK